MRCSTCCRDKGRPCECRHLVARLISLIGAEANSRALHIRGYLWRLEGSAQLRKQSQAEWSQKMATVTYHRQIEGVAYRSLHFKKMGEEGIRLRREKRKHCGFRFEGKQPWTEKRKCLKEKFRIFFFINFTPTPGKNYHFSSRSTSAFYSNSLLRMRTAPPEVPMASRQDLHHLNICYFRSVTSLGKF